MRIANSLARFIALLTEFLQLISIAGVGRNPTHNYYFSRLSAGDFELFGFAASETLRVDRRSRILWNDEESL